MRLLYARRKKKDGYSNSNLIFGKHYFTHRSGFPPLLTLVRPARGGGTDLWRRRRWRQRLGQREARAGEKIRTPLPRRNGRFSFHV
jgi:hypothetical protein